MNDKVTPIKSAKPAPAPPDCIILDADTTFMVGMSLRSWSAGVPITDAADIAHLERANVPRKSYELIQEQAS
jgi:hypothetical protein